MRIINPYEFQREQVSRFRQERPKYTLPLSVGLAAPVVCILYDSGGQAVGWFEAERVGMNGRLP
jgi:hypothetical protein